MGKMKINRGTTFPVTINYTKDGNPHTLVGATVRFTVKTSEYDDDLNDTTALIAKNITNGDASGVATITLTPEDTQALTPGELYYDVKVDEDSDGVYVYKVDEGTIELDASPTNRL